MRTIIFSDWQEEKKSYLRAKARRLSKLSPKDRISRRPIDPAQIEVLRTADKKRTIRLQKEGKIVWTGPREVRFRI